MGAHLVAEGATPFDRDLVCDPQTSGGLLIAAAASSRAEVEAGAPLKAVAITGPLVLS